jgi:hypothetical protein
MRCHKVQGLLPDYIGDELFLKKREQVEGHLKECSACQAELAALQGVWDGLVRQSLPSQGEEFWHGFTARVMKDVRKRRLTPAKKRMPLLLPGWRVLLPAAGAAAAVIALVIVLTGGPGTVPNEQGIVAEVTQPFFVAPLAGDDEDPLGGAISLNGGTGSEQATLTEALTQLTGDEGLAGQLEELDDRELQRFEQLLSARYPLS